MRDYHGHPVGTLSNKYLELDYLTTGGPRIVRLSYKGSQNLLAEVPQISVPTPFGDFHYLGGHRLWHAPEALPRSYVPDDDALEGVEQLPSGVVLNGKVEAGTGIRKRIEIRLDADALSIRISHHLINEGLWEVKLAPWAITMFRLGGIAILPMRLGAGNQEQLLPDRHLALWAYSHLNDARLQLHDGFAVVRALPDLSPFKIGVFNPIGWIAYYVGDVLFRKSFDVRLGERHPDGDCNGEIYCDEHFIELESLAPLCKLAPGASVTHEETWELYDSLEQNFLSEDMNGALGMLLGRQ